MSTIEISPAGFAVLGTLYKSGSFSLIECFTIQAALTHLRAGWNAEMVTHYGTGVQDVLNAWTSDD